MLNKFADVVLASLRGLNVPRGVRLFARYGLAERAFWVSCVVCSCCSRRADQWRIRVLTELFRSLL